MRRLLISLTLASSLPALAQQAPLPAPRQDQGDRILREEMERERERLLRQQAPRIEPPAQEAAAATDEDPATVVERAPMFRVERIEVEGGSILPARILERRLAPFRGLELGAVRIGRLLQGLNQDLIDAGFITSRAYALSQNLSGGVLGLRIVPEIGRASCRERV